MSTIQHNMTVTEQAHLASQNLAAIRAQTAEREESNSPEDDGPQIDPAILAYNNGELVDNPVEEEPETPEEEIEDETEIEPEEPPAKKPKQTAKERISELTYARREAERKLQEMQARLEALEKGQKPPENAPEGKKDAKAEGRPDPKNYDYGAVDEKYIEDLADWKVDQRMAAKEQEREAERAKAAEQEQKKTQNEKWNARIESGKQKYEDFDEVVLEGAQNGEWLLSQDLAQLILDSEVGDDIAYHLASHPSEAERVYHMTPLEQARYFGAVEARLTSKDAPKQTAKVSKAPEPVTRAKGAQGKFNVSPATNDFREFERMALKELR